MLEAMIEAVGEVGYTAASVGEVLERAGTARQSFYNEWANREACFVEAHRQAIGEFADRVVEAGSDAASWRAGLRAAMTRALELVIADPSRARALFIEVHCCRPALPAYYETLDRFATELDRGREDGQGVEPEPPLRTGAIVVGGLEQIIRVEVIEGASENAWRILPELMHFAVLPYLGPQAAQAELASAPLAPPRPAAGDRRTEGDKPMPAANGDRHGDPS